MRPPPGGCRARSEVDRRGRPHNAARLNRWRRRLDRPYRCQAHAARWRGVRGTRRPVARQRAILGILPTLNPTLPAAAMLRGGRPPAAGGGSMPPKGRAQPSKYLREHGSAGVISVRLAVQVGIGGPIGLRLRPFRYYGRRCWCKRAGVVVPALLGRHRALARAREVSSSRPFLCESAWFCDKLDKAL